MPAPHESAKQAGLRYVTDSEPGIRRQVRGKRFGYIDRRGKQVTDKRTLQRIQSLVIPPAWTDVWICADPNGHLQATGRDDRGRKQSRYHPRWRQVRDETKFDKIIEFSRSLPVIRRTTRRHIRLPGLPREKVLATVVMLLEKTLIRVGNDEYARENKSFGLTTIRDRHVRVNGKVVQFDFRGKSGVERQIDLEDKRLAKIVKACQDLPGYELFQYIDGDGVQRDVTSGDVNEYLREISGGHDFTAKDFRTWAGTVLAAMALQEFEEFDSEAKRKKNLVAAIEKVARELGNTKAVCRKCYIHPAIIDSYLDGSMLKTLQSRTEQRMKRLGQLKPEEAAVIALLRQRLAKESHRGSAKRG